MSEFKYACPVCGQHIRCDSSQAGSTMTCPTCFQEIIVPQAPDSDEQKLILTGSKVGERHPVRNPELNPYASPKQKPIPGIVVVLAIFLLIGIAVGFVYYGTIFKPLLSGKIPGKTGAPAGGLSAPANAALAAPMASDTNWLLDLGNVTIPDSIAAGRIHGQNFQVERAVFSRGSLILRTGRRGPVTFGVTINFNGAEAAALSDKNLNILADTNKSARVTLHWQQDNQPQKDSYEINYALRLDFGELTNRHLPGRIYLCTPDAEKSYVIGTFNAEVSAPKDQPK